MLAWFCRTTAPLVWLFVLGCSTKADPEPWRGGIPHASLEVELTTPQGKAYQARLGEAYEIMTAVGFGCADRVDEIGVYDSTDPTWDLRLTLYTTWYWSLGRHRVVWEEVGDPYHMAYADPLPPECVRPAGVGVRAKAAPVDELVGSNWTRIEGDMTVNSVWEDGLLAVDTTIDVIFDDPVALPGATLRVHGNAGRRYVDERPRDEWDTVEQPDAGHVPRAVWDTDRCQGYLLSSAKRGCVGEHFDTSLLEEASGGVGGQGSTDGLDTTGSDGGHGGDAW